MGQALSLPFKLAHYTRVFYGGFWYYLCGAGRRLPYLTGADSNFPYLRPSANDDEEQAIFKQYARIHLFSLASEFYLYNKPHYRKGSYRDDLVDNLRNIALPGTGIPLSIAAANKLFAMGFILTVYPAISLLSAFHNWFRTGFQASISQEFATRLLAPEDWFSYWRLNCNVVGLHSLLNKIPKGYTMENKWTFLEEGDKKNVPVSPFLKTPGIVVKHRNEEGGMGIHFYRNAVDGGDWIIQERIQNSEWVTKLLPTNAPLSTFRVITQSRASLNLAKQPDPSDVTAICCVFRAGRKNAATDHDAIFFDVDVNSGKIREGATNSHWYRLGLLNVLLGRAPWRSSLTYSKHPDGDIQVAGNEVPGIRDMLKLVEESHLKLCPDVPLAGWDVVSSADESLPICLLEVNLSCNFFMAKFDRKLYLDFVDEAYAKLQAQRLTLDQRGEK